MSPGQNQLRLWPGVLAVTLQWLLRFGVPAVFPDAALYGVIGGLLAGLAVLVWWAFFSRAPRIERWGAIALMVASVAATSRVVDKSIATGMMGMLLPIYAIPILSLGLVLWAAASRGLGTVPRRLTLVVTVLLACGMFGLLRTDGLIAGTSSQFKWRWSKSPEERLLERASAEPLPPPIAAPPKVEIPKEKAPAVEPVARPAVPPTVREEIIPEWPGFRGPNRDGVVHGLRLKTDWTASPLIEKWRRPVGPAWSSMATGAGLLYTQEQRGESEVVACYRVATGEPVWAHRDAARFWESNAGAGPRSTPTLSGGNVYTLGATGIVNALNAATGALIWTRNAATDTGAKIPGWGFAGSPLVLEGSVIVAASGRLVAYALATGNPRWTLQTGGGSYGSPHLLTIDGVAQVVLLNGSGATGVSPADGKILWKHAWQGEGAPMLQPAMTADGGLLITSSGSGGSGTRRLTVAKGPAGWTAEERWTSTGLKPYFSDLVVHNGHAFGFDGAILSCIDLQDGRRKWKGGRYGHGQMVLLADQNLLLVLSEEGEVALVGAGTEKFEEIARFRAMDGKTWNHPVISAGTLLVRNAEEMVAFQLPLEKP